MVAVLPHLLIEAASYVVGALAAEHQADQLAQLLLELDQRLQAAVTEQDRLGHDVLGQELGPGLDHHQPFAAARDDQVELALLALGEGRVDDVLAVEQADADAGHGLLERQLRDGQGRRGARDRQHVGVRGHAGVADGFGPLQVCFGRSHRGVSHSTHRCSQQHSVICGGDSPDQLLLSFALILSRQFYSEFGVDLRLLGLACIVQGLIDTEHGLKIVQRRRIVQ